jgi:hypothetical protein
MLYVRDQRIQTIFDRAVHALERAPIASARPGALRTTAKKQDRGHSRAEHAFGLALFGRATERASNNRLTGKKTGDILERRTPLGWPLFGRATERASNNPQENNTGDILGQPHNLVRAPFASVRPSALLPTARKLEREHSLGCRTALGAHLLRACFIKAPENDTAAVSQLTKSGLVGVRTSQGPRKGHHLTRRLESLSRKHVLEDDIVRNAMQVGVFLL